MPNGVKSEIIGANMSKENEWETIYKKGEQLNAYPFTDVVAFYCRVAPNIPHNPSCLDVGSGSGVHSFFLAEKGGHIHAIDASHSAISAAKINFSHLNIEYEVQSFSDFSANNRKYDLVIDRLSTSHSTVPQTASFYQNLKPMLNNGARLFWQGFSWDNDGRLLGQDTGKGSWNNFSSGLFKNLGNTAFFKETDLDQIFSGYERTTFSHISQKSMITKLKHSIWTLELTYEK